MLQIPQEALITDDGYVTAISSRPERHPLYGTDAYGMNVEMPLRKEEQSLLELLQSADGEIGKFLLHIRSFLAQLGVDAFYPETTQVRLAGGSADIRTLLTSLSEECGHRVIEEIRRMVAEGRRAYLGRGSLLPLSARLNAEQVRTHMREGDLVAEGASVASDGALRLPLLPMEYRYDAVPLQSDVLQPILAKEGSGRRRIFDSRKIVPSLPSPLASGQFFVGGFDLHTRCSHAIIDTQTCDKDGNPTNALHLSAVLMDAGRTFEGDRQAELRANGRPVDLARLRLHADLYRAAKLDEPGV